MTELPAELERRLAELERPENQGGGFTAGDWIFLIVSGIVAPILLLWWGW